MIFIEFRGFQGVLVPENVIFIDFKRLQGFLGPERVIFIDFRGFLCVSGARRFGIRWQPVAPCGNGLDALKKRDMAILEGKFRDMSTGGLEARRLVGREDCGRLGGFD